ncbi:MAG: sulfurtransferase TusA family protein [Deltaproteobacteria bacterium]|nr:sulfurtransferase TusA family protein [Deltaproteobacteria bacterium]
MNKGQADRVLDVRGWSCPWCLLKAKSWLRRMNPGQILEVLSTDRDVQKNFPRVLSGTKDRVISIAQNGDHYSVRVRRGYGEDVLGDIASLNEAAYINLKLEEQTKKDEREDYHGRDGS